MKIIHSYFESVLLCEYTKYRDCRGFFTEISNRNKFKPLGIPYKFVQDGISFNQKAGTLRGMHFQVAPKAQNMLVYVLEGAVCDVFVDVRPESPSFGQWASSVLTGDNGRFLYLPRGFAHGFCTLIDQTLLMYKMDDFFAPEYDLCFAYDDPDVSIMWPQNDPVISEKDSKAPRLNEIRDGIVF